MTGAPASLAWVGLQLSFQRLGIAGWSAADLLRSWASAPFAESGTGIAIACPIGEAIWIGVREGQVPHTLRLACADGWSRQFDVPPDWQIGAVSDGGTDRPLAIAADLVSLPLRLTSLAGGAALEIELIRPDAFAARFGGVPIEAAMPPDAPELYSRIIPLPGE